MKQNNRPFVALLAAALLFIPAVSFAENLLSPEDPASWIPIGVKITAHEGDPSTSTNAGSGTCLKVEVLANGNGCFMTKPISIDSTKRYRFGFSIYSEEQAQLVGKVFLVSADGEDLGEVLKPDGAVWNECSIRTENGKTTILTPSPEWTAMEIVVGPGESKVWPTDATHVSLRVYLAQSTKGASIYIKDLQVEQLPD